MRSWYRMEIFFGLLKFQTFFGVLEIPDIFFLFFLEGGGVKGRCWARAWA